MRHLKPFLLFFFLLLSMQAVYAWTIGAKGRSTGPSFHTTYFLTPNNQAFKIKASIWVGQLISGTCQYEGQYEIGFDTLRTGDFVDLDAFALKSTVGGGYACMAIYYFYRQVVMESLQLFWDGFNYIGSFPLTSEVTIL